MGMVTIANARILTMAGSTGPRRGEALRNPGLIERGHITITDGLITEIVAGDYEPKPEEEVLDVNGCVLMPTFVDCHTHACWAGNRLDEFERKLRGDSYLDILKDGGGIMSTVRDVREASEEELTLKLLHRLSCMAALGTGTIEIKSGYGLNTEHELKMLRAIHIASTQTHQTVVGTFLGAHAIDPENPNYIDETIEETLPAVESEFPGIVCDAYCEEGAWSLKQTQRLFEKAMELGCPLRVHADQFNSLGMTKLAVDMGALSVDHLEAITPEDLRYLAQSQTVGVVLPGCGFHLDDRYAPARRFVDEGGLLAIATNYNPGSSPTQSMPFVIALACRKLHLTPLEAIACSTYNAACVLGLQDQVGSLEVGKRAHIQVLDCTDERELAYELATPGPLLVVIGGQVAHLRSYDPGGDEEPDEED